jgi:hypothetical protein
MIREPVIESLGINPKNYQMSQSEEVRQNKKTPVGGKTNKDNREAREARAGRCRTIYQNESKTNRKNPSRTISETKAVS